jgi:F0F1-type ATP synthase epsilon subunit
MPLEVRVSIPKDRIWNKKNSNRVILPGIQGNLTILTDHARLVTLLDVGLIINEYGGGKEGIQNENGKDFIMEFLILHSGFAIVNNNNVDIFGYNSERISSDLKISKAKEILNTFSDELENIKTSAKTEIEIDQAVFKVKVAKAHLKAIEYEYIKI